MKRSDKFLLLVGCVTALLLLTGCSGGGSTFTIHTFHLENGAPRNDGYVATDGVCGDCLLNRNAYPDDDRIRLSYATTDQNGYRTATGKYVNLNWTFARYTGSCGFRSYGPLFVGDTYQIPLECTFSTYFSAVPESFDVNSPPSSLTFSGDAVLNTTYDLPVTDWYDENGNWIGSTSASSVANDGTSMSIATPNYLLSQYSGSYIAVISNVNESYSTTIAAAAAVTIYGNDPPPPPQCDCGMTCEEYDQTVAQCQGAGGTWLSWGCVCQGP